MNIIGLYSIEGTGATVQVDDGAPLQFILDSDFKLFNNHDVQIGTFLNHYFFYNELINLVCC